MKLQSSTQQVQSTLGPPSKRKSTIISSCNEGKEDLRVIGEAIMLLKPDDYRDDKNQSERDYETLAVSFVDLKREEDKGINYFKRLLIDTRAQLLTMVLEAPFDSEFKLKLVKAMTRKHGHDYGFSKAFRLLSPKKYMDFMIWSIQMNEPKIFDQFLSNRRKLSTLEKAKLNYFVKNIDDPQQRKKFSKILRSHRSFN